MSATAICTGIPHPGEPIRIGVEMLRLCAYLFWWVGVVLPGIILTRLYNPEKEKHSILTRVFGYNNICVYFDYPPSTYVLPVTYALNLIILIAWFVAFFLRMRQNVADNKLDSKIYTILIIMKLFEAFAFIYFSTIFAVSPDDTGTDADYNEKLYIHVAPWFFLQLGLVSLAISSCIYGHASGYWNELHFIKGKWRLSAWGYCATMALLVCFKIPQGINGMAKTSGWDTPSTYLTFSRILDYLHLMLIGVVPLLKSAYLVWCKTERIALLVINIEVDRAYPDEEKAECVEMKSAQQNQGLPPHPYGSPTIDQERKALDRISKSLHNIEDVPVDTEHDINDTKTYFVSHMGPVDTHEGTDTFNLRRSVGSMLTTYTKTSETVPLSLRRSISLPESRDRTGALQLIDVNRRAEGPKDVQQKARAEDVPNRLVQGIVNVHRKIRAVEEKN